MAARILLIEDHPANLQLMTYLLHAYGFDTFAATDGAAGVEAAIQERPALVVCDIQLPILDGYEVVRRLKGNPSTRALPVVAVTAFARPEDHRKVVEAGFDGYLTKPIDPQTFVTSIQKFMAQRETAVSSAVEQPARRTILVVDDNRLNLDLARVVFESSGHEVLTADTPLGALALARKARPDLILSDVVMRETSGFEFLLAVKADAELQAVPFVFISSTRTSSLARREGLALGAAKYLFRPIEPDVLLRELEPFLRSPGTG